MKIYENIYIGSFIYQLGVEAEKQNVVNNSSVNLFQQTPSDKTLSDLITGINGKFLILEFKNERVDSKEKIKYDTLKKRLEDPLDFDAIDIKSIGESCHYLAIGKDNNIKFYNYINYFNEKLEAKEYSNFIRDYMATKTDKDIVMDYPNNAQNSIGISNGRKFKQYLEFLQETYLKTGGGNSTSGLIVVKNDNGEIGLIPTDNIEELVLTLDQELEKEESIEKLSDLYVDEGPTMSGPSMF